MRSIFTAFLLCFGISYSLLQASSVEHSRMALLTLLLRFDGDRSETSVAVMKRELHTIMASSVTSLEFRLLDEVAGVDAAGSLVVVTFRGSCRMDTLPPLYDDHGPLAFTHTTDGEVLPFSEVHCERIKRCVRSSFWGGPHGSADELLGRAMGRVIAHELYHILGNTCKHGTGGIAKTSLTAMQLVGERLILDPEDVDRMVQH